MRLFAMFLLTMLLAVPAWAAQVFEGKVVGISDGDTLTVLTDQKQQIKVRLYGVDCPETKQAYGTRARQFTSDKVFGKRVRVEVADTDRYGRTVGIVTAPGGSVLNSDLLAGGMGWLYTAYCKKPFCRDWKKLEEGARIAHKGLWADTAVPPWEFRKADRSGGGNWGSVQGVPSASSGKNSYAVSGGGYSGNTNSGIFHASTCRYYNCKRCTAHFSSREAAIQAGYRPCKVCRP